MFTGLIQGQGELVAVERKGREAHLCIKALFNWEKPQLGESVAVNGACLSVERFDGALFWVYASAETLTRTTLGAFQPGAKLNLERALALGDRLGGHLVSGHVDTVAQIRSVADAGDSLRFNIGFDAQWASYVIPKGSVALDGISLTINNCGQDFLEVNVIPETQRVTTISGWRSGVDVNMETDMLGKYVLRSIELKKEQKNSRINEDFLRENGFI